MADSSDIYIGIGSNLGDREGNLRRAISAIQTIGLELLSSSSIYETEPVDYREQPWFLNQVVRLGPAWRSTSDPRDAEALLSRLLAIEKMMGRKRLLRAGPRIIDLDLLFYGSEIIGYEKSETGHQPVIVEQDIVNSARKDLVVPHQRLHLRRFVLVPLSQLAADLIHPVLHKTVAELLVVVGDKSIVRLYRS